MRSTRTIIFGSALVVAALVFVGILRAINRSNSTAPATPIAAAPNPGLTQVAARPTGQTAYAATDIPAGSIVTREMLEMRDNKGGSTVGFVTDPGAQAEGFITRVAIPAGSQLRPADDFIGHISQVGIAGALQPGTRALVVPVPGKPTLHDLVKIGNSVDILAAFDGQESRTIAQNMRVLAVDVFANDYPVVNAAMRGPYKAAAQGRASAPNAPAPAAGAPGAPAPTPAPPPQDAPRPEPTLTLEVTPQQAAAIQLALASNSPIDFLVRPALPANRSGDVTLVSDEGASGGLTSIGVIKPQIAPYAEALKRGKNNAPANSKNNARTAATRGDNAQSGPRFPVPDAPPIKISSSDTAPPPLAPAPINIGSNGNANGGGNNGGNTRLAPAAPSTYQIPIYSDGGVVRTETVPVPIR